LTFSSDFEALRLGFSRRKCFEGRILNIHDVAMSILLVNVSTERRVAMPHYKKMSLCNFFEMQSNINELTKTT